MRLARHTLQIFKSRPGPSLVVLTGMFVSSFSQIAALSSAYPIMEFISGRQSDNALAQVMRAVLGALGLGEGIGSLLLLFLGVGVAAACAAAAFDAYQKRYIRIHEEETRRALVRAVMAAEWPHLRSLGHGEFINVATQEVNNYRLAAKLGIVVASSGIAAAALAAFALWLDWRFSLAAFAIFGAGAAAFFPIFRMTKRTSQARVETANAFASALLSSLRAAKTIKAGSLEDYALKFLEPLIHTTAQVYYRIGLAEVALIRVNDLLACFFIAGLMFLGTKVFDLDMAVLMTLMMVFYRLMSPVRTGIDAYNQGTATLPAIDIVNRTLEGARERPSRAGGKPLPGRFETVELKDVTYRYPGAAAPLLARVSLTVRRGEFWLIAGHTGCGKTTLLDLALGLARPDSGQILINGTPIDELDLASWHARIGYLSQEALVFSGTVRSNLLWGSRQERSDAELKAALAAAKLDGKPLDMEIVENGQNLSGGEKQRLSLARILLRKPELLVFDEPTSALDKRTEEDILKALAGLKGATTALIVSHEPKLRTLADRTLELGAPTGAPR